MVKDIVIYLQQIKGVKNIETELKEEGKEEIRVRPLYDKMAKLGITAHQLSQVIRSSFEGLDVTSITREGEEINFPLMLDKNNKEGIDLLNSLEVPNRIGQLIKLSSFCRNIKIPRGRINKSL